MEDTSAQESIRQLLLRIGSDDNDGPVLRLHRSLRLMNVEFHLIQFPEKIVGEFQIRLVNLVDQQNHLLLRLKSLSQLAQLDITGDIIDALLTELTVVQSLNRIVHIQTILCLGGGFYIPDDQLLPKGIGDRLRQHRLARARLTFHEQWLLQGNRHIDACQKLLGCNIVGSAAEILVLFTHFQFPFVTGKLLSFLLLPFQYVIISFLACILNLCYDILSTKARRTNHRKEDVTTLSA